MKLWQGDLFQGVRFGEVAEEIRLTHKLTAKVARFVYEYLIDENGTQAAIRAGFSAKTAAQAASRMLRNVKVRAALEMLRAKVLAKCEVTAERVMWEASCMAFSTPKDLLDAEGNPYTLATLPEKVARSIMSFALDEKGQLIPSQVKFWPKADAVRMVGQNKKLWAPDGDGSQAGRFILVTG